MNWFSHSDGISRDVGNMPKFKLSDQQSAMIRSTLLKAAAHNYGESTTELRRVHIKKKRLTATLASVLAVVIFSVLVYQLHFVPSSQQGNVKTKSTKSIKSSNQTRTAKEFYSKMLGFQPMLPRYIPAGMKFFNTSVSKTVGNSFSVQIGKSPNAIPQQGVLTLMETPVGPFAHRLVTGPSWKEHKTISYKGLSIRVYESTQLRETVYVRTRGEISYSLSIFEEQGKQSDALKILASLTVPETQRPKLVFVQGTPAQAMSVVPFKASVPTFIPKGFAINKSLTIGKKTVLSAGVWAQLILTYTSHPPGTEISIWEELSPTNRSLMNPLPATAKPESLAGHKVYFQTSRLTSHSNSYTYQWTDRKTGVIYTVEGTNPDSGIVVDVPTLQKVVLSMMK